MYKRQILEEQIILDGIGISLVDTAGIRKTEDAVEKIGVSRAKDQAKDADLIIYVVDSSVPLDENDLEIIELIQNRKSIVLLNKSDLETYVSVEELQDRTDKKVISVSARENTGIEALTEAIKEMFYSGDVSINEELYITNERHKIALQNAYKSLELVKSSIEGGLPEDFFSIDLMDAYEQLGVILGESVDCLLYTSFPVLAPLMGFGGAAEIDGFQSVGLTLRIVSVKYINPLIQRNLKGIVVAVPVQFQ